MMKEEILGYAVDALSVSQCTKSVIDVVSTNQRCKWLASLNPHSFVVGLKDRQFAAALKDADWLIPDGIGVVLVSLLFGGNIRQRVTGSDIFFALQKRFNKIGCVRVFFLGGTNEALTQIRDRMERDFSNVQLAGTYSPPFKDSFSGEETDVMITAINSAKADILWVGLTAPKQEKWIYDNKDRLNVRFVGAIGAVFDFYAGTVRRSPLIYRKLGLEWLPRLIQQPRRLWRRTFSSAPIFIWHVLKSRLKS